MAKHVQSLLLKIIRRDFPPDAKGKHPSQRTMSKKLGLSQPVISAIKRWQPGKGKSVNVGIGALIALSDYERISIDAVLGRELPLATQQRQEQLDRIIEKSEELAQLLDLEQYGPRTKIGKLREEIRTLGRIAKQQKTIDERERAVNEMRPDIRLKASGDS